MTWKRRVLSSGRQVLEGIQELAFPSNCCLCGTRMSSAVAYVCVTCRAQLTTLDLHKYAQNAITDRLWGRITVDRAAALLPYTAGAPAQRIMWLLKYDNRPDVGVQLGAWFGHLLAQSTVFGPVDAVVPVPLHPRKQRLRGYNQAERISAGLALGLPSAINLPKAVVRNTYTETQTKKSQFARMENVEGVFSLSQKEQLVGRHVLIVDDVMTTGATLESLGKVVLEAKPASLKVACLALARPD